MLLQGRFLINVIQWSSNQKYGLSSLWMTDLEGQHIGGYLTGPLIAGTHIQAKVKSSFTFLPIQSRENFK